MPDNKFSELFAARDKTKDTGSVSETNDAGVEEDQEAAETHGQPPDSNSSERTQQQPSQQNRSSRRRSNNKGGREEKPAPSRAAEGPPAQKRLSGRPPGKRSNPDYEQATIYIRRDTHRAVKLALLQQEDGRQFSELVEDLLRQWVNS